MQLPRPNTYIKIKDIEQLKLLCEYKNDKVRHYTRYTLQQEINYFKKQRCIYFLWYRDGNGTVGASDLGYTEITDDSFLYPNKKPMDNFIITDIDDSNREEVLKKINKYDDLKFLKKALEINMYEGAFNRYVETRGYYKEKTQLYKDRTFITASEFLGTKSPKPKKEKQEVFINKFHIGEMVYFWNDGMICHFEILNIPSKGIYGTEVRARLEEKDLFKTKSQLIKSLSKQWRQEVEDRILSLTK